MQPRHNWHKFGAQGNRGKIADLLTNTVANGKKYPRGASADQYEWVHQGKKIIAVVSKKTGEISDGWVK